LCVEGHLRVDITWVEAPPLPHSSLVRLHDVKEDLRTFMAPLVLLCLDQRRRCEELCLLPILYLWEVERGASPADPSSGSIEGASGLLGGVVGPQPHMYASGDDLCRELVIGNGRKPRNLVELCGLRRRGGMLAARVRRRRGKGRRRVESVGGRSGTGGIDSSVWDEMKKGKIQWQWENAAHCFMCGIYCMLGNYLVCTTNDFGRVPFCRA
jgi:hypothetical protein